MIYRFITKTKFSVEELKINKTFIEFSCWETITKFTFGIFIIKLTLIYEISFLPFQSENI